MSQTLTSINKNNPPNPTQETEEIATQNLKVTTDQQYPIQTEYLILL